jgi:hypothetical protein
LDKLVQLILARQQLRRTNQHAAALPSQPHLATDSRDTEDPIEPSPLSLGSANRGREPS